MEFYLNEEKKTITYLNDGVQFSTSATKILWHKLQREINKNKKMQTIIFGETRRDLFRILIDHYCSKILENDFSNFVTK